MRFENAQSPDEEFHKHQIRINKMSQLFWKRMTDMITGPDHEYVYLRRIIKRINDHRKKKEQICLSNYNLSHNHCKKLKRKYLNAKRAIADTAKESKA